MPLLPQDQLLRKRLSSAVVTSFGVQMEHLLMGLSQDFVRLNAKRKMERITHWMLRVCVRVLSVPVIVILLIHMEWQALFAQLSNF